MGRTGVGAPFMQLWDHIHWVINTLCSVVFEEAPTRPPICSSSYVLNKLIASLERTLVVSYLGLPLRP